MKPAKSAGQIVAELEQRGLRERAEQIAKCHGFELERILPTENHEPEIVDARQDLFIALRELLPSHSAVARLCGVDHSTVSSAVAGLKSFDWVKLDEYQVEEPEAGKPIAFRLQWQRGRENAFGVVTICGTPGDHPGAWEKQTEWFRFFPQANTRFITLMRDAGAPSSYHGPSPTPDQIDFTPAPASSTPEATS